MVWPSQRVGMACTSGECEGVSERLIPGSTSVGLSRKVMNDFLSPQERSVRMGRVRSKHTTPELRVRRLAHKLGLRFRLHRRDLPGTPDLVLAKHRTVVFVNGCFWHRHAGCRRCTTPRSRTAFWSEKFAQNVARDERNVAALKASGWKVLTIWECETMNPGRLVEILRPMLVQGQHDTFGRT